MYMGDLQEKDEDEMRRGGHVISHVPLVVVVSSNLTGTRLPTICCF